MRASRVRVCVCMLVGYRVRRVVGVGVSAQTRHDTNNYSTRDCVHKCE